MEKTNKIKHNNVKESFFSKYKKWIIGFFVVCLMLVIIFVVKSLLKPSSKIDTTPIPIHIPIPKLNINGFHNILNNGVVTTASTIKAADIDDTKYFIDGKTYYKVLFKNRGKNMYVQDMYQNMILLVSLSELSSSAIWTPEISTNKAIWLVEKTADPNIWNIKVNYYTMQYIGYNSYKQPITQDTPKEWTYNVTTGRINETGTTKYLEYNTTKIQTEIGFTVDALIPGTMSEFDMEFVHDSRTNKPNGSICRTHAECATGNCTGGFCLPKLNEGEKYKLFFKNDTFGRYLCASTSSSGGYIVMSDDQIRDGCTWITDVVDNKLRILQSNETIPGCLELRTNNSISYTKSNPTVCNSDAAKWKLSKYNTLKNNAGACISFAKADTSGWAFPNTCNEINKINWTPEYFGVLKSV